MLSTCEIDHLRGLVEAERNGRLAVLPCKLHETIYHIEDADIISDTPYEVTIGQKQGEREDSILYACIDGFIFYGDEVGKTVFLTRTEAEAALGGGGNE